KNGSSHVNRLFALPDYQVIYVGYANGDMITINTKTWQQETMLHVTGAIQDIAGTSDGRIIAVTTNDGNIHVGTREQGATRDEDVSHSSRITWVTLAMHARRIALAPDGLLLASCTDGTIWLY